jgi:Flp pilus assembly protein TadG
MARRRLFGIRSERGAVVVEAALVTPLLMALLLGIIEMALLMKDDVALTSAVRNGGRIASANAAAGPGGVNEGGDCLSPCSPANAPMFAQLAANAIQTAGTALPKDSIQELWVYKANSKGYPCTLTTGCDTNTSTVMTCGANCVKYKWVPAKDQFRYFSGTWISSTVNACANSTAPAIDVLGVYMLAKHDFVSGFFGKSVNIEDRAVFTFEPLPTLTCASGAHT